MACIFLKANRASTAFGLQLAQSLFIQVGSLLSFSQVGLCLAELGQVHGSNLFSLLDLLLVRLNLGLELVNQSLHALVVLAVFIRRVGKLLDPALRLAQVLGGIRETAVFGVKLGLQLTDASLHLVHSFLASLQSVGLGLIQTLLHGLTWHSRSLRSFSKHWATSC